mgnify:CR=1 FL=1
MLWSVAKTARHDAELDLPAQGSAVKSCRSLSGAVSKNLSSEAMANYGFAEFPKRESNHSLFGCRRQRDKIALQRAMGRFKLRSEYSDR